MHCTFRMCLAFRRRESERDKSLPSERHRCEHVQNSTISIQWAQRMAQKMVCKKKSEHCVAKEPNKWLETCTMTLCQYTRIGENLVFILFFWLLLLLSFGVKCTEMFAVHQTFCELYVSVIRINEQHRRLICIVGGRETHNRLYGYLERDFRNRIAMNCGKRINAYEKKLNKNTERLN